MDKITYGKKFKYDITDESDKEMMTLITERDEAPWETIVTVYRLAEQFVLEDLLIIGELERYNFYTMVIK